MRFLSERFRRAFSHAPYLLLQVILAIILLGSCRPAATLTAVDDDQARLPDALEPLVLVYPQDTMKALTALKGGIDDYLAGHYDTASEALAGKSALIPVLGDYQILYRAKANLMLDKAAEALQDFRALEKEYPGSINTPAALVGQCQALLKLKKPAEVLGLLQRESSREDAETIFYRGRALEDIGERAKAEAVYLQILADHVTSSAASQAEERIRSMAPRAFTSARNIPVLMRRAESLLRSGSYRESRSLLQRLQRLRAPDPATAERLTLLLGEAEYRLGRTSTALTNLKKVRDPTLEPEALYYQVSCHRRLQAEKSMLAVRDKSLARYPQSPQTERVLYSLATYYDVNGQLGDARKAYEEILEHFPQGEHAQTALWKVALFSYVAKDYEKALDGFRTFFLGRPESTEVAAPLYWMGRCYEKLGSADVAVALYNRVSAFANHSYYGQRARESEESLGRGQAAIGPTSNPELQQVMVTLDRISDSRNAGLEAGSGISLTMKRIRLLVAADLADLALAEVRWAIRRYPQEKALSYVMSRVYTAKQDYHGAIVALREAFPDYASRPEESLPRQVWDLLYPAPHLELVSAHAKSQNLDSNLVLGVIRQESAFNESARSTANARGLMQILPATGRTLARRAGISGYSTRSLYRADTNIALGTRYLSSLLQRLQSREELALAAYNAGVSRVDLWVQRFGNADMAEFVELIPFSETRSYIKQVLTNKALYGILKTSDKSN